MPYSQKIPIFQEKEISSSNIKKTLISLKRKLFLHSWKWNPALFNPGLKKKKKKKNPPKENLLYLRKKKPQKNLLYFLKRKLLLYFRKQK